MNKIKVILVGLLVTIGLRAEVVNPVHWSSQPMGDSLVVTATIDSGWHMTLISIADSMVGEEYADTYSITLPLYSSTPLPLRYNACDDKMCTAPEIYNPSAQRSFSDSGLSAEGGPSGAAGLLTIFLLGLLGGLMAIFTPCVWPIIPMTVSFFLKKQSYSASGPSAKRSFSASGPSGAAGLYGLAIVVIYVGLGLLVTAIFGASALNAMATNAVLNLFFFVLFVVFALSFFGLFEITLPASWSTYFDKKARSASGVVSVLFMAFTLVIVSFSCTGPIIGTLLVEAASQSYLAPTIGMLGFAIALALPFSLLALFPTALQRLPKSGLWMQHFKVCLAFIELALSLKFLSVADVAYGWGILPRWLFFVLWTACFLGLGLYLLWNLRKTSSLTGKIIAIFVGIASMLFSVYSAQGIFGRPVPAVAAFAPPMPIEKQQVFLDYEQGLLYAKQQNEPVLLVFSGYGCVNCRKMEARVIADEAVQQRLQAYTLITLYVDSRQDQNNNGIEDGIEYSRLQRERFGSNAQPFYVQLDANNQPISQPLSYTTSVDEFLQWLKY